MTVLLRTIGPFAGRPNDSHVVPILGRAAPEPGESCSSPGSGRRQNLVPGRVLFLALGGIGDTVLTFAAARELRARLPNATLHALTMWPQSAELLDDLGVFDVVGHHHFQSERLLKSLNVVARLRRARYDATILTYPANRFEYNLVQWLIHGKTRIGHEYLRGSHLAYLRWLLSNRVPQVAGTHGIEENLRLVRMLGMSHGIEEPDISAGPLADSDVLYATALARRLGGGPFIGIHAGSSTYKGLGAKRWPPGHFASLCRQASEDLGLRPLLFGTQQDAGVNAAIQATCPQAHFVQSPSIRRTAAMLRLCEVFLSNDSALGHLATAMAVPTVMVVGPTNESEVRPWVGGVSLRAGLACSPCFGVSRAPLRCTNSEPQACMNEIRVDRVLLAVKSLLPGACRPLRRARGVAVGRALALPVLDSGHPDNRRSLPRSATKPQPSGLPERWLGPRAT